MSAVKEAVLDRSTIRTRLRKSTQKEFVSAHTKTVFIAMAATLGVDAEKLGATKDLMYDQLVANAGLPDQSLRGGSTVKEPVAAMWSFCEAMYHSNGKGEDPPRRKDIIAAAKESGIAHHTARTQYQSWWKATLKGTRLLADVPVDELPRALQPKEDEKS